MCWFAVYTIVRHEKLVNNKLRERNVETFLPLKKSINQWKDRKKTVYTPLFPGYLFVNIREDSMYEVLNTRSVIRLCGNSRGPVCIPHDQIDSVRTLVQSDLLYEQYPYLEKGREVIIADGPLEGYKGKIIEKKGYSKVILCVDLIKRSISVEIGLDQVELT